VEHQRNMPGQWMAGWVCGCGANSGRDDNEVRMNCGELAGEELSDINFPLRAY